MLAIIGVEGVAGSNPVGPTRGIFGPPAASFGDARGRNGVNVA